MPNEIPPYLKLHIESSNEPVEPAVPPFAGHLELLETFEQLTGWTLAEKPDHPGLDSARSNLSLYEIDDMSADLPPGQAAMNRVRCEAVLEAINKFVGEVNRTRKALRDREAELATAIPVIPNSDESRELSQRLESILHGAVNAVGSHAAALYVLDDSTSQLKLRSSWQLPADRYLEPPRPLRGAIADLEALVGHAVVLEDTQLLQHWHAPEDFPSAVCVPVSSSTTPLGTLWVFSAEQRDFSTRETELLEIVAGRVVAELEREAVLAQGVDNRQIDRQLALASSWQQDRLPTVQPIIDDLAIAGWTSQSDRVGGDFHDWNVLCDGRLGFVVGDAQGATIEAGLTAASLSSSVRSHQTYRPEPGELITGVNEAMWSGGMGDQFASLFYGLLNPADWNVRFGIAGSVVAYRMYGDQIEAFEEESPMLGIEPDLCYREYERTLGEGDSLVILSDGMRHALWQSGVSEKPEGILEFLQRHILGGCDSLVGLVKQVADTSGSDGVLFDRAILALQRTGPTQESALD